MCILPIIKKRYLSLCSDWTILHNMNTISLLIFAFKLCNYSNFYKYYCKNKQINQLLPKNINIKSFIALSNCYSINNNFELWLMKVIHNAEILQKE